MRFHFRRESPVPFGGLTAAAVSAVLAVGLVGCSVSGDPTVAMPVDGANASSAPAPSPAADKPAADKPAAPDPAAPDPAGPSPASPSPAVPDPVADVVPVAQPAPFDFSSAAAPATAPADCLSPARIICVDKNTAVATIYENSAPTTSFPVRFGDSRGERYHTGEGHGHIYRKSIDHVSSIYGTPMPYAMFISWDNDSRKGQAFHYSTDFAAEGYDGASHGCMNIGSEAVASALFESSSVGTEVFVYRS